MAGGGGNVERCAEVTAARDVEIRSGADESAHDVDAACGGGQRVEEEEEEVGLEVEVVEEDMVEGGVRGYGAHVSAWHLLGRRNAAQ